MKKDLIFFTGDTEYQGIKLTMTSANHIANMAKEYYMQKEKILQSMQFYSTSVSIIGSSEKHVIESGITIDTFNNIPIMIADIAKAKSLIAWLREAISARDRLKSEINKLTEEQYCAIKGIELPVKPECEAVLTEADYWGSMNIKARNAYYELETKCATLGQLIHPGGNYASQRYEAVNKINVPHKVVGTGRDTNIYTYEVTVPLSEIEEQFFELQKKYREYQANLNSMKFECQKAIEASEAKVNAEYTAASKEYAEKMCVIRAELLEWKKAEIAKLGHLKIIIPDSLQEIYTKINSLGKN